MWRYKDHVEARFGMEDEELRFCQDRVTRIDFQKWRTFYYGDPEHWTVCENSNYISEAHRYRLPVYKLNKYKDGKWEYRYIKFLTADDYRQFNFFIDELDRKGEDWQNLHEISELAEVIGKISAQRLEEIQKRTQQAYDDNIELMKKVRLQITGKEEAGIELSL